MKRIEKKKEKWIIRRYLAGMPVKLIAAHLQISTRVVHKKIANYKKVGENSFEEKALGKPKDEINKNCKKKVRGYWEKFQCGSVKLHRIMTRDGYGISQYKIQQTMDEFKLTAPCPNRRGQRKYCSYRWPEGFRVLHTDWAICPVTKKRIIAYIDDHSRFIVGYGLYDKATTKKYIRLPLPHIV